MLIRDTTTQITLVNGLFKGGGAKGAVYAGALQAMHAHGFWFKSVAGTSAGAITAALIGAGATPEDIAGLAPRLLGTVRSRPLRVVLGTSDAWFDNRRLGDALEAFLTHQVSATQPVTFEALFEYSGITLYVVAFDLETRAPLVFSHITTPSAVVSQAVLASTAIPGAFGSGRALFREASTCSVHRLVDGGLWANYPRFVFRDASFRQWLRALDSGDGTLRELLRQEEARQTVGFALNDHQMDLPPKPLTLISSVRGGPREFDLGTLQTRGTPGAWMLGKVMAIGYFRIPLALGVMSGACLALLQLPAQMDAIAGYELARTAVAGPLIAAFLSLSLLLGAFSLLALSLLVLLGGQLLGDVVVPSAIGATSVSTGVPPWVDQAEVEPTIILPVGRLRTTAFKPVSKDVAGAIADAERVTREYLSGSGRTMAGARAGGSAIVQSKWKWRWIQGLTIPLGLFCLMVVLQAADEARSGALLASCAFLLMLLFAWITARFSAVDQARAARELQRWVSRRGDIALLQMSGIAFILTSGWLSYDGQRRASGSVEQNPATTETVRVLGVVLDRLTTADLAAPLFIVGLAAYVTGLRWQRIKRANAVRREVGEHPSA